MPAKAARSPQRAGREAATTTTTNGGLATSKEETLWGATQTEWRIGVGSDAGSAVGTVAPARLFQFYIRKMLQVLSILSEINLQTGVPALRVQIVPFWPSLRAHIAALAVMMSLARPDPRRLPSRLRVERPPLHTLGTTDAAAPTAASCGAFVFVHPTNSSIDVYMHLLCRIVFLIDSRSIRSCNDAHRRIVQ